MSTTSRVHTKLPLCKKKWGKKGFITLKKWLQKIIFRVFCDPYFLSFPTGLWRYRSGIKIQRHAILSLKAVFMTKNEFLKIVYSVCNLLADNEWHPWSKVVLQIQLFKLEITSKKPCYMHASKSQADERPNSGSFKSQSVVAKLRYTIYIYAIKNPRNFWLIRLQQYRRNGNEKWSHRE